MATILTKWLVVAYGILGGCIAFASSYITGVSLAQISGSLLNASTGATLGVYLLASCVPKSTWQGAFVGSLASLGLVGWICAGSLTQSAGPQMLPLPSQNCSLNSSLPDERVSTLAPALPTGLAGLYSISFQWYGLIGAISCVLVGIVVSLPNLLSSEPDNTPQEFLLPGVRQLLAWLRSPMYNRVAVGKEAKNGKSAEVEKDETAI